MKYDKKYLDFKCTGTNLYNLYSLNDTTTGMGFHIKLLSK